MVSLHVQQQDTAHKPDKRDASSILTTDEASLNYKVPRSADVCASTTPSPSQACCLRDFTFIIHALNSIHAGCAA